MLSYNRTKKYGLNYISLTNWDNVTFNHELHWSYVLIFLIRFDFPLKNLKFNTTLTSKRGLFKPENGLG